MRDDTQGETSSLDQLMVIDALQVGGGLRGEAILAAKRDGKTAIIYGFQNTSPIR